MKGKKVIIGLLSLAMGIMILQQTYAYYSSQAQIQVLDYASMIRCDASISSVPVAQRGKFGYSEIKVTVKNYRDGDLTDVPFHYTIRIENSYGDNGLFGYNNVFNDTLTITDSMENDQTIDKDYIIQVKSVTGLSEYVDYRINLDCVQDN